MSPSNMKNVNIVLGTVVTVFVSFLAGVEFSKHQFVWMSLDFILAALNLALLISGVKMRAEFDVLFGIHKDLTEKENGK